MATTPSSSVEQPSDAGRSNIERAALHRDACLRRIVELEEEIRAIKVSYNSASSAYNLPPEILSKIFLEIKALSGGDNNRNGKKYAKGLDWIVATQVCQKWRDAAVDCAELWSTLSLAHPDLTSVMLERSKQAPLTITLDSHKGEWPFLYSQPLIHALQQVHRLRSVKFLQQCNSDPSFGTRYVSLRESFRNWTGAAPVLRNLDLKGIEPYRGADYGLPTPFLQGGAPALKRMSILNIPCFPTLKGFNAPNMTFLYLAHDSRLTIDFPIPSANDLLGMLATFPSLKTLYLANCLPTATDTASYARRGGPLQLKNLEALGLTATIDSMAFFMAACRIPYTSAIFLCQGGWDNAAANRSFQPGELARLFQAAFSQCREVNHGDQHAGRPKVRKLEFQQGRELQCWLPYRGGEVERLSDFLFETPRMNMSPVLDDLWPSLNFSELSVLKLVDIDGATESRQWYRFLGQLTLLKTIEFHGDTDVFFQELGNASIGAPNFVALSSLTFSRSSKTTSSSQGRKEFGEMVTMLSNRWKAGVPIPHVVVVGGVPLQEEQYEVLREKAPETRVEWRALV